MRVLLLEDNPGDARLVREYLREVDSDGVHLDHAESLTQAVDLLKQRAFDAALIDLSVPESDGIATYRAVRSLSPTLPIVVLSGYSDEQIALQAVQEGAQDYLLKGRVDGQILIRALHYACERQQLEQQRRDFVAMASHELRNPLATILGWAEVLRSTQKFHARAVESIVGQASHLDRLISDLIDVARLDAQQLELRVADVDLVDIARESSENIQKTTTTHDIRLESSVPTLTGSWDRDRLQQVLQNVLSNAVKYSPEGGVIAIHLRECNGMATISVTDGGIGLSADVLGRLFSRFYRSQMAKESRNPGLGLGLHITRSLVEAHGGSIHARSPGPGRGSTFTITLPLEGPPASSD